MDDKADMTTFLRSFWLPDAVDDFSQIAVQSYYKENSVLFWDGDPSDRLFFIEKGMVQMYHYTREGVTVPLLFHQRGELVGLGGVLCGTVRKVNAKTLRPSIIWEISRSDFFRLLREQNDLAIWVAFSLSERLQITDQEVLRAVVMASECRLAISLLELAKRGESIPSESGSVRVFVTHTELSQLIGACRQTVTTTLGKFKRQGILKTGKGYIDLLDLPELERIAGHTA